MVPARKTTRVYLNEKRQGVATCVHCDVTRTINMSNYTDHSGGEKPFKVKCGTCHTIFHITFDHRRYQRTPVNFPGKIFSAQTEKDIGAIIIISLSFGLRIDTLCHEGLASQKVMRFSHLTFRKQTCLKRYQIKTNLVSVDRP